MAGNSNNLFTRLIFEAEDRASGVIGKIGAALATWFAVDKLAGFFSTAIGGAAELQKQFSALAAATGASGEEVAKLKAKADELGASDALSVSSLQAAQGMTELARAGQSTSEVLSSITPVIALAQGAQLELAQAAGIVTANLAGFQLAADQSGRVADVLSTAANATKTSVKELADALSYVATSAASSGMSIEETTAIIAKMQNAGIDGTRAGTALNTMLAALKDPASQASKALDAAGISTRNFSGVMAALEKGGPLAEKAIVEFGTEAGPGLRALLVQGSASVKALETSLQGASGSAEKAAATMNDNLLGAAEALSSVWEGLKQVLVEPLLEPIEREARSLAATLANFTQSAQMEQLKQVLVATFETGVAQLRAFAGAIDWPDFAQSVSETLTNTLASLKSWGENVGAVKDVLVLAFEFIATGVSNVRVEIAALKAVFNTLAATALDGFSVMASGLSKITFGGLRDSMKATAQDLENLAQGFRDAADKDFAKMDQAAANSVEHANKLRESWEQLNAPSKAVAENLAGVAKEQQKVAQLTPAQAAALKELEAAQNTYNIALQQAQGGSKEAGLALVSLGANVEAIKTKYDALRAGADGAAPAITAVGTAAKDTRTPLEVASQQINALEIAYQAFMGLGNIDMAAKVRSQIEGIQNSLKGAGAQAGITADDVASAFRNLGVQSQADLAQLADTAKKNFETIRDSGMASQADIQNAFTAYAEKAIAANNGVADTAIQTQAAILGMGVVATDSGDQVVKAGTASLEALQAQNAALREGNDLWWQNYEAEKAAAEAAKEEADALAESQRATTGLADVTRDWSQVMKDAGMDLAALGDYASVAEEKFKAVYQALASNLDSYGIDTLGDYAAAFDDIEQKSIAAAEAAANNARMAEELDTKLTALTDAFDQGSLGASDYLTQLERLRGAYSSLSSDELTTLDQKIQDVKASMREQANDAVDSLNDWKEKLMDIYGQEVEIQKLQWQQDRAEAEIQLAQARRDGNAEEIAALEEKIRLIDQYYKIQVDEAAKKEAADKAKAAEDAATEAARRAALSQAERDYEDKIAALEAQLAEAIKAGNEVWQKTILDQIQAIQAAYEQAKTDTKSPANNTANTGTTQPTNTANPPSNTGQQTTAPVKTVTINVTLPSGLSGSFEVPERDEDTVLKLFKSLETGRATAR